MSKWRKLFKKIAKPLAIVTGLGTAYALGKGLEKLKAKKKKLAAIAKEFRIEEVLKVTKVGEENEITAAIVSDKKDNTKLYLALAGIGGLILLIALRKK